MIRQKFLWGCMLLSFCAKAWCLSSDQTVLLDLKDQLKGDGSSWNTGNSNPCDWTGVVCSGGFVKNLTLHQLGLAGSIPSNIGYLQHLTVLDLSTNNLTGSIPQALGNLSSLESLDLSTNNLTGSIPEEIGNLRQLKNFSAYQNSLEGRIPLMNSQSLQSVNLAANELIGDIPNNICASGQLKIVILSLNNLSGILPDNLSLCSSLTTLRVGQNLLTGAIPNDLGQLENLIYFEANNNYFTGQIPRSITGWRYLRLLNLADNKLTGDIPVELSNASRLEELILSNNQLSGSIPPNLSFCANLSLLDLSENNLTGTIPSELFFNLRQLNRLRLQGNSLTGPIPSSISGSVPLLELQLGSNNLVGKIPSAIGSLSNLQVSLNLSLNQLTGYIPDSLSQLSKLVYLDLSHNSLSGTIPDLGNMLSLLSWNFSYNELSGPVPPIGSQKLNSSMSSLASSYAHNAGLCGGPLPPCADNSAKEKHRVVIWQVAGIAISCALVVLGIFSGVAAAVMHNRHFSSAVDPAPSVSASRVFMDSFEQAVNFDSIKDAIRTSANIISSNHFSTIYKAVMPSGLVLAAKKLHGTEKGLIFHQRKMSFELDKLWRLAHANIMRPIGYFLQNDLAIILYDFVPLCSLSQQLHRNSQCLLTWHTRYEIALGAARGLAFLHHSCHPPIMHMDVNSNNILLGPNFEVQIGDVEIAKLLDPSKNTGSISAVAGSFGYIAPEYAFTMRVTLASNIYSFGVVLLELVTGRLPIDETFGDGLDLVKWVHGASSRGETPEQILDAKISAFSFTSRQEMLAVLKVALLCTNASPLKRPRMKKILDMLLESKLQAETHAVVN